MKGILVAIAIVIAAHAGAQSFAEPQVNEHGLSKAGASSSPALVKIDGDADLDVVSGYYDGWFAFFENKGLGGFPIYQPFEENPWGLSDVSNNSTPFFADLDADGDLDLLSGSTQGLVYFENTGTSFSPNFDSPQTNPFSIMPPQGIIKPYMTDIDGDDDLDLFIGAPNGSTYYFENTGRPDSAAFADPVENPFGLADVGSGAAPAFADVDGDGDADAVIGEGTGGDLYYFENKGTATAPDFDSIGRNLFGLQSVDAGATPYFGDLDFDGKPDIICGNTNGDLYYFKNTTPVGTDELRPPDISIYPNPASRHITIDAPSRLVKLEVFNSLGKKTLSTAPGKRKVNLEVRTWQPGIYLLKAILQNGLSVSRKLLVAP